MNTQAQKLEHYDQLKKDWEQKQVVSVLFSNALGAIVGNLINISLVAYLLYQIFPDSWLPLWFAFGILVNCFRLVLYVLYKKNADFMESQRWLDIYRITTLVSGMHFGLVALYFFSSDAPLHQALIAFFVGGSISAAVGTHGVDLVTYRLFLFPSAVPLFFRALLEGTDIHTALAVMVILLMIVMHRCASQTQKTMLDNISMSYSLNYRATHDSLVSLYNREEFINEFQKTQHIKANKERVKTLIFIDLDDFKALNDTYGHHAGDEALVKVGDIIRASIRKSDIAARFGGDEFMVLLYVDVLEDALAVCSNILQAITQSEKQLHLSNNQLGASIGIGYTSDSATTFKALLKAADRACYQAKKQGKGQVCSVEVAAADRSEDTV